MCFDFLNSCFNSSTRLEAEDGEVKEVNSVRVFAVSPVNPQLNTEAALYRSQDKKKGKKVKIKELHDHIQQNYPMEMNSRMLIDKKNILISKMIQNLYVSSLGGVTPKSMKIYRIQLMINATNDLPNVDDERVEMLRVPMTGSHPTAVEPFLDDVVDKIQASSFKNISTLVYCYDGLINSLTLVACKSLTDSLTDSLTNCLPT